MRNSITNNILLRVFFFTVLLVCFFTTNHAGAQRVVGDNLGNHKASRRLDMNRRNIDSLGAVNHILKSIPDLPAGGTIGSSALTVDSCSFFAVNQTTTAGLTLTLPTPTSGVGATATVLNVGTKSFYVSSILIDSGQHATFVYAQAGLATSPRWLPAKANATIPLSAMTAATATNTIDNQSFAQTWNWSTATTQTPMSVTANALTTGSILSLTSSSTANTGTAGMLYVANKTSTTTGTLARFEANSTAGSGLTVLANGRVGIGNASPGTTLDVAGDVQAKRYFGTAASTIAAASTISVDLSAGNIIVINVDASIATFNLTNTPTTPQTFIFKLNYSTATTYTIAWPSSFKWSGGTAPTLTCTAGKTDILSVFFDGTSFFASYGLNF